MYNIFVLVSFDVIIYTYFFLKGTDTMLKKSTYIFLSVLLCIPLILVIYFSVSVNTEKPSADLLVEITIDDPNGKRSFFDDRDSHELFANVVGNAFKVSAPSRDLSAETPAVVTHIEKEQQYSYNYYMSSNPEECYFTNTRGETYQLDSDDAKDLLSFEEFIYVYDNYAVPTVTLSANGKKLMYHNHDMEFTNIDGQIMLQLLADKTSAEELGFTLDSYWVQSGGGDYVWWLNNLKGRVDCVHYKDYAYPREMRAVGDGNMNWDAIIAASLDVGAKYAFVEQDNCNGLDPFYCLKRSYDFLKAHGLN